MNAAHLIVLLSGAATPALPPQTVIDSFNRLDSATIGVADTGQAWETAPTSGVTYGTPSISANRFVGGTNGSRVVVNAGTSNVAVEIVYISNTSGTPPSQCNGIMLRYVDGENWLVVEFQVNPRSLEFLRLQKRLAGVNSTTTLSTTVDLALPVTLRVECVGTTYTVKANGTVVATFTDTDFATSTKHGLAAVEGTVYDDFRIDPL